MEANISDKQVCLAYSKMYKNKNQVPEYADSILQGMTGHPMKVCHSAMQRAYDHGLIESGISLRSGWLTEKGERLVK